MSLVQQLLFPENELLILVIKFATACKHIYIFTFFSGPGGGVLLEILSGGVPPRSPNPDPISDQIFHARSQTRPLKSIAVFRPGLWAEIILSLLRLGRNLNKKLLQIHFKFAYFSFFLTHNKYAHTLPQFPQKSYLIRDQNGQNVFSFSNQNSTKTLPNGDIPIWLI